MNFIFLYGVSSLGNRKFKKLSTFFNKIWRQERL